MGPLPLADSLCFAQCDCLWVMDEVQLMGAGLSSSVAGFRENLRHMVRRDRCG